MPDDAKSADEKSSALEKQIRELVEADPIVTEHELALSDRTLRYTASVGMMPATDPKTGDLLAGMFYTAYTAPSGPGEAKRPLIVAFNGGPGSSSIWLHMGALGPKRVRMEDEGWMPAPPYELLPNPYSWLAFADLVFVDPVGTGFSRAINEDHNKKFWGVKEDLDSVAAFIRLFLSRFDRWGAPLYLAGESYGTTRAAGLAGVLVDHGIGLNGVILISTILNFQTGYFNPGNDLPFPLYLPTYTATAWYHHKLPEDLLAKPLPEALAEAEAWAESSYTLALMKGDRLNAEERADIVAGLTRYTGLDPRYVDLADLRPNIHRFCKELHRDERRTVGRLDSRFEGFDQNAVGETPGFDPSYLAILPPYTTLLNQYLRQELGFKTDISYEALSMEVNQGWEHPKNQYTNTAVLLRDAFNKNPHMTLYVGMGYYDLATPYFAALYTLNHMELDPAHRENITTAYYEAGHMYYIETRSLVQMTEDIKTFVRQ